MSIFSNDIFLDPKYQDLDRYVPIMYKGIWTPAKYESLIKAQDAPQYFNEFNVTDQECTKRCILAVSVVEDQVKTYWCTLCMDLPQTVIGDVGGVFAQSEVTHRRSYHALVEALKINPNEIYEHEKAKGRINYLQKHLERDPKIIGKRHTLKKLVLFTALVERASLFTQFYILMSFAKANKGLKTIAALQRSTAIEEKIHYSFGIDVINIIKEEEPQLWSEYLVELIEKNIKDAYQAELDLLDWFFEKGVPSHITKEEVVNFMRYNFSVIAKDLKLDLEFDYDVDMYQEKNIWFSEKTLAPTEVDFFDNASGGYSSTDEEIDVDSFEL